MTPLAETDIWQAVTWISKMKQDRRGPYEGVAWHCQDGSVLAPRPYACADRGGGFQCGLLGAPARKLAKQGIFVGTVLAALDVRDLLRDRSYRARALVVERYLERALDGWVLASAKHYRGFRQVEDEVAAAGRLLRGLATTDGFLDRERNLVLRLMRALPYGHDDTSADEIRAFAAQLGDTWRDFGPIRFKLHAMPEPSDIEVVQAYALRARGEAAALASSLAEKLRKHYDPATRLRRLQALRKSAGDRADQTVFDAFVRAATKDAHEQLTAGVALLREAERMLAVPLRRDRDGEQRLRALHIMGLVEEWWLDAAADLSRARLRRADAISLTGQLVLAARILGLLSQREAASAKAALGRMTTGTSGDLTAGLRQAHRLIVWARARIVADLNVAVARYQAVEPRAHEVVDDMMRSSVIVPLSILLDRLETDAERLEGRGHRISAPSFDGPMLVRGENPGLAVGPLRVLDAPEDSAWLEPGDIALLTDLPPSLPPVAGVITLGSAGSLSHVALLARNLGIPHAGVGLDLADRLRAWAGQPLVLGVSAGRRVALARLGSLSESQRTLVEVDTQTESPRLVIDASKLALDETGLLALDDISPSDAGTRVGPKAAELARLRRVFPGRVSDAVVIPFGAFLRHVDRPSPDGGPSPLSRLRAAYGYARELPPEEGDALLLAEMARFRQAIAMWPFAEGFASEVDLALGRLGQPGSFGVFVRSDTNCEDLKKFTGAGLNKTVPNRVKLDSILSAIREVWASPFREQSFRWRKKMLRDPEHLYPGIILHRSVHADISGVLVTADIESGDPESFTVSASEGVAAVVDGGSPETVVVSQNGAVQLLRSARSSTRKVIPDPPAEGVVIRFAQGREPLLSKVQIQALRGLVTELQIKFPAAEDKVPWDVEFGFVGDELFLFQMRPLRLARAPAAHPFLRGLDAASGLSQSRVDFDETLP